MPKLIYKDPESGQDVSVQIGGAVTEVTIGRNPGNVVRVNNPSISRRHATIVFENGKCCLYDLNSSNGSYINGARIRSQILNDGDRVRVGEFPVDFVDDDSATAEVSPEMIESVLQQPGPGEEGPPRNTNMGGFGPLPTDGEERDLAWGDAGIGPRHEEAPQVSLEVEPIFSSDQAVEEAFEGIDDALQNAGAWGDDGSVGEPDPLFLPVDDVEVSPPLDEEGGEHGSTVEHPNPVELAAGMLGEDVGSDGNTDLRSKIKELEEERDELFGMLQSNASDSGGGAKLQIDRLRKERDRLTEERRNLMRQVNELTRAVEEAPSVDAFREMERGLEQSQKDEAATAQQLEDANHLIATKDSEIGDLRGELGTIRNDLDSVQGHFHSAEEAKANLDAAKEQLQADLESARGNLEKAGSSVGELEQERDGLKAELDGARQEIADLQIALASAESLAGQRDDELVSERATVQERDRRITDLESTVEAMEGEIDSLRSRGDELAGELADRPMTEDLAEIRAAMAEAKEERDAAQETLKGLTKEKDELAEALAANRQLLDDIQSRYDRIGGELKTAQDNRDRFKKEKEAYSRETDYLQVERRKLNEEVEALKKEQKTFAKEDKRKKKIFAELSADLRKLVDENSSLNAELAKATDSLENAPEQSELAALEESRAALADELEAAVKKNAEIGAELASRDETIGSLTGERDDAHAKFEAMTADLEEARQRADDSAAAIDANSELAERCGALEEERDGLREELDTLKGEDHSGAMQQMQETIDGLNLQIQELEEQGASSDGGDSAELQKRIDVLEKTVASAKRRETKLKKSLDKAETAIAEVIEERDSFEEQLRSQA